MTRAATFAKRFSQDISGATAIEYGLVATFISLAILVIIQQLGANVLHDLYDKIAAAFSG